MTPKADKWSFAKAKAGAGVCCDCGKNTSTYSLTDHRWRCNACRDRTPTK